MDRFNWIEILQLFSNLMVGLSGSSVYSVLYLILTYLFSSLSVIINHGNTFIGFIIIMIYIGAVCILFLFCVLLLDLREASLSTEQANAGYSSLLNILILTIFVYYFLNEPSDFIMLEDSVDLYIDWNSLHNSHHQLEVFGHLLWSEYFFGVIVAALTLFVALMSAVTISLSGGTRLKRQTVNKQLARQSAMHLRNKS
jgi:NADH-quinone oxidoreductase subunit J